MHPSIRPLGFTYPQCKVNITLCHVRYTLYRVKASLRVAPRANRGAIRLSSRLARRMRETGIRHGEDAVEVAVIGGDIERGPDSFRLAGSEQVTLDP